MATKQIPDFELIRRDMAAIEAHFNPALNNEPLTEQNRWWLRDAMEHCKNVHSLNDAQYWGIFIASRDGITDEEVKQRWHLLTDEVKTTGDIKELFPNFEDHNYAGNAT